MPIPIGERDIAAFRDAGHANHRGFRLAAVFRQISRDRIFQPVKTVIVPGDDAVGPPLRPHKSKAAVRATDIGEQHVHQRGSQVNTSPDRSSGVRDAPKPS
jgi:hypothetical protein